MEKMTKEEVMQRMNSIAKELGLPLEDDRVPLAYFKRYPGLTDELADKIFPIWFTEEKKVYALEIGDNEEIIAVQRVKDGEWEEVKAKQCLP